MVSVLDSSRLSGLSSSLGWGHYIVFIMGRQFYFENNSASLHSGVSVAN